MVKMSGGEALVKSLVNEGVEVVFGIPGIHMSGTVVALRDEPSIRLITTRHEQGAAHMADGYARASGKPGQAFVVPGTGVYNAAGGLATAYARSSPVLLTAGQIPRGHIGKDLVFRDDAYGNVARDLDEFFDGTYETDLHNPDLVKFAESFGAVGMRADDPMDLATLLPEALEREAPVVIDVPTGHIPLPRAKQHAHLTSIPWTMPQEGLIPP